MRVFPLSSVRLRTYVAGFILLASACLAAQTAPPPAPAARPDIVAVGDVHGAFDEFVSILRRAGVIDAQNHWAGSNLTFVQVGDMIDRGPKPREVMDLMMALQQEAQRAGGRVVPLLGNHEVMNIMGDLRYVTPGNYASFADSGSEQRRHAAYLQFDKWRKDHATLLVGFPQSLQEQTEAEWDFRHPVGFVEQREAYGPGGKYGKWLREHDAIAKINGVVFLHAGISPVLAGTKLDEINSRIHKEIASFDHTKQFLVAHGVILPFFTLDEIIAVAQAEMAMFNSPHPPPTGTDVTPEQMLDTLRSFLGVGDWLCVSPDGPLWFRGYSQWKEEGNLEHAAKLLEKMGATRVVVGHTPQNDRQIHSRFGGKIFLIDTGMLSSYYAGGQASALELFGNSKITAQYMDRQIVLVEEGSGATPAHAPAQSSH